MYIKYIYIYTYYYHVLSFSHNHDYLISRYHGESYLTSKTFVKKMVCDKDVCQRWCVTKMCAKDMKDGE